jgi:elongation factor Ts
LNDLKKLPSCSEFNGITVAEKLIEQTGYRRKIRNQNFEKLEGFCWILHPLWNKIATLVALSARVEGAEEASRNVAMQAAAMFHRFR